MPRRAKHHYTVQDMLNYVDEMEERKRQEKHQAMLLRLHTEMEARVCVLEKYFDYCVGHPEAVSTKLVNRLEELRAKRGELRRVLCENGIAPPPKGGSDTVGNTGESVSPKAAKASKSSSRPRAAKT